MDKPFLILHKVRGLPAFDIAALIGEDSDGPIWIIPTSGHRAYPYWTKPINEVNPDDRPQMPDDWPDHYATNDRPIGHEVTAKPKPKTRPTLSDLQDLLS